MKSGQWQKYQYQKGLRSLTSSITPLMDIVIKTSENMSAEIVSELRQDPRVAFVEPDQRVHALGQTLPVGVDRVGGDVKPDCFWGRERGR